MLVFPNYAKKCASTIEKSLNANVLVSQRKWPIGLCYTSFKPSQFVLKIILQQKLNFPTNWQFSALGVKQFLCIRKSGTGQINPCNHGQDIFSPSLLVQVFFCSEQPCRIFFSKSPPPPQKLNGRPTRPITVMY